MMPPGFDLNLLRILLALDRTRHVTRAAELLNMSQSGFSSALARLRQHSGDALFVRNSAGMTPTPRAERMIEAANRAMATVHEGILAPPDFDPASARTEFRLAMSDLAEVVFLPRLLGHLQKAAPGITLRCDAYAEDRVQDVLASGEVDLALGYYPDLSTQTHMHQRLYRHTFACMVRSGHPLAGGRLTAKVFAAAGHVVVTSPSRSGQLLELQLRRRGIKRRVVLSTPHHLSLPAIVSNTDLIATVPLAVAMRFAESALVRLVPLPFLPDLFDVQQHWHRRYQHDPRHSWFRRQLAMLFNEASDRWLEMERSLYGTDLRGTDLRRPRRRQQTGRA